MNHPYPALDLQCLNDRDSFGAWSAEISFRDCLAVIVAVVALAGWGIDRWRTDRIHATISSALIESKAAADRARSQEVLANEQLRTEREMLASRLQAEVAIVTSLRREIAGLESEARPAQGVRYAVGRER